MGLRGIKSIEFEVCRRFRSDWVHFVEVTNKHKAKVEYFTYFGVFFGLDVVEETQGHGQVVFVEADLDIGDEELVALLIENGHLVEVRVVDQADLRVEGDQVDLVVFEHEQLEDGLAVVGPFGQRRVEGPPMERLEGLDVEDTEYPMLRDAEDQFGVQREIGVDDGVFVIGAVDLGGQFVGRFLGDFEVFRFVRQF